MVKKDRKIIKNCIFAYKPQFSTKRDQEHLKVIQALWHMISAEYFNWKINQNKVESLCFNFKIYN